jgi:hypothetical protein
MSTSKSEECRREFKLTALLSILGRTGLGKPLMISSTVCALLGDMVVLLFVCEGRGLLDGNTDKKLTKTDDLH